MKRTVLLTALLSLLATACTIDKDYDLSGDNLDKTIVLAKGYSIPVGSFEPVYLNDILPAAVPQGTDEIVLHLSETRFNGADIIIEGLDHLGEEDYSFTEATLKMVVKSTIPCNFTFTGELTDNSGTPIAGSSVTVTGDINEGSTNSPAYSPVTFEMNVPEGSTSLSKIVIHTAGDYGSKTTVTHSARQYLQFTEVSMTLDSGILIKNK